MRCAVPTRTCSTQSLRPTDSLVVICVTHFECIIQFSIVHACTAFANNAHAHSVNASIAYASRSKCVARASWLAVTDRGLANCVSHLRQELAALARPRARAPLCLCPSDPQGCNKKNFSEEHESASPAPAASFPRARCIVRGGGGRVQQRPRPRVPAAGSW